jgi:ABC-type multidrug transport system fused ATPase/permease subunit
MEVLTSGSARRIYLRLIGYAKPYWRMFAVSAVGMVFYAITEPLFAAMMKPLLDGTFIDRDITVVQSMPLILMGIFLVRGIAGFINTYVYSGWASGWWPTCAGKCSTICCGRRRATTTARPPASSWPS